MSLFIQQVNPAGSRVYMGVLTGGVLLHDALASAAREVGARTASFDLLGGLTEADLTAYDFTTQARLPAVTLRGALEICAGHGTISLMPDGALHVHTHLMLGWRADEVLHTAGGHCARAVVYAVEFTLCVYDGAPMRRTLHPPTGLMLWGAPIPTDHP